jgi:hypothetical protein
MRTGHTWCTHQHLLRKSKDQICTFNIHFLLAIRITEYCESLSDNSHLCRSASADLFVSNRVLSVCHKSGPLFIRSSVSLSISRVVANLRTRVHFVLDHFLPHQLLEYTLLFIFVVPVRSQFEWYLVWLRRHIACKGKS